MGVMEEGEARGEGREGIRGLGFIWPVIFYILFVDVIPS